MKRKIMAGFVGKFIPIILNYFIDHRYPKLAFCLLKILGRHRVVGRRIFSKFIAFSREVVSSSHGNAVAQKYVEKFAEITLSFSKVNFSELGLMLGFICELDLSKGRGSAKWYVESLADRFDTSCVIRILNNSGLAAAKLYWCFDTFIHKHNRQGDYSRTVRMYRAILRKDTVGPRLQYCYLLALMKAKNKSFLVEAAEIDFSKFGFSQNVSMFCQSNISDVQRKQVEKHLLEKGDIKLLEQNMSVIWVTSFFLNPDRVEFSQFSSQYVNSIVVADYLYTNIFGLGAEAIRQFLHMQIGAKQPVLFGPVLKFLVFLCGKSITGEVTSDNVGPVVRKFFGTSVFFSLAPQMQSNFFRRLVFRGSYSLEQLLKPSLPFDSPSDINVPDGKPLVITTSDRNVPEFLSADRTVYDVITLNRRVEFESSIPISDLWRVVSKDDFNEIISVCSMVSDRYLKFDSPLGMLFEGEFLKEVIEVSLEDAFFPYLRDILAIDRFVAETACNNIYFHCTEADFQRNLGYALFLRRRTNVCVFFTFHKTFWNSSCAILLSGDNKTVNSLLLGEFCGYAKGVSLSYKNGIDYLYKLSALLLKKELPSEGNDSSTLILASTNDPSYRAVTLSIASALSKCFNTFLVYIGKDDLSTDGIFRAEKLGGAFNIDGNRLCSCNHSVLLQELDSCGFLSDCPVDLLRIINEKTYIYFLPPILKFFLKKLPLYFLHFKKVLEIVHDNKIDLIVAVPGRHPTFRGLLLFSNMNNVPSIDVQAFFTSDNPRYKYSLATRYLTISEDQKLLYEACYKERGLNATRFGSFTIDAGLSEAKKYFDSLVRGGEWNVKHPRHIVFAAQHGLDDFNIKIIEGIVGLIMQSGGKFTATLKAHPRSTINACDGYRSIISAAGADNFVKVVHKESIYKILPSCDVLVTQFSNVGLEAAALGIDVVTVNLTKQPLPIDMEGLGIAVQANSIDDLILSVNKLFNDVIFADHVKRRREAYFSVNHELRSCDAKSRFLAIAKNMISGFK